MIQLQRTTRARRLPPLLMRPREQYRWSPIPLPMFAPMPLLQLTTRAPPQLMQRSSVAAAAAPSTGRTSASPSRSIGATSQRPSPSCLRGSRHLRNSPTMAVHLNIPLRLPPAQCYSLVLPYAYYMWLPWLVFCFYPLVFSPSESLPGKDVLCRLLPRPLPSVCFLFFSFLFRPCSPPICFGVTSSIL